MKNLGDRPVHVVGGGIAGLVAAITAAEAGAPVILHEAAARVGGRALGPAGRPGLNLGPHVVLTDGALARWLAARDIRVGLRLPALRGIRVLGDGGAQPPLGMTARLVPTVLPRAAPAGACFRDWAQQVFGAAQAGLLCQVAGLFTFHHDPGELSAQFVWDRYRRVVVGSHRLRMVAGSWSALAAALAGRAIAAGVRIQTQDTVTAATLPDAPTVVATRLPAASRLLERELMWPGTRTALLDVAATHRAGWPSTVLDVRSDLRTCCLVDRTTATHPGLPGPGGEELFQAQLGIGPQTSRAAAVARVEDTLDAAVPQWRERAVWQRSLVVTGATGPADPPGTTWRDRPAIDQGDGRFLAGDAVAAPGMLSEAAVNSGVEAARQALAVRRRRVFPAGWPGADLTPERRLAVLAAVLPGATLAAAPAAEGGWPVQPVDQTGLGYRLTDRGGLLRGEAVAAGPAGPRVTTLAWNRLPRPLGARLSRRLVRWWARR
ncbi:MAG TPA: NAD(P)-binding protein [Streptosporangiaceae bacterium]|jgi:hypothetical protein